MERRRRFSVFFVFWLGLCMLSSFLVLLRRDWCLGTERKRESWWFLSFLRKLVLLLLFLFFWLLINNDWLLIRSELLSVSVNKTTKQNQSENFDEIRIHTRNSRFCWPKKKTMASQKKKMSSTVSASCGRAWRAWSVRAWYARAWRRFLRMACWCSVRPKPRPAEYSIDSDLAAWLFQQSYRRA